MRRPLFAFALLLATAPGAAQVCRPATPPARQPRPSMRHRDPTDEPGLAAGTTDVRLWRVPIDVTDPLVRGRDAPIDEREAQTYSFTGDVWRVTWDRGDCGLALELSDRGAGAAAPRVVAVIPSGAGYDTARNAVLAGLPPAQRPAPGRGAVDLARPLAVTVTGLAYYDGSHWTARDPMRGSGHGSSAVFALWEIDPVWRVTMR